MSKVSICIPTFNHAQFVGDAVRSAMRQTHANVEILVLDNASNDETPALIEDLRRLDPRIRYVRHPTNLGLIGNFNACLRAASGDYIKFVCSDDVLEPECVARMVQVLEAERDVALVACARALTDADLHLLRRSSPRSGSCRIDGRAMIAECFFLGNRIGEPSAVMFRATDATRGFADRYEQLLDLEMYFHLLKTGRFALLGETLCKIRQHQGQQTWSNDRTGRIVSNRRLLFRDFKDIVRGYAGLGRKLLWDVRMAYAVQRARASGAQVDVGQIQEIYFARLFRTIGFPLVTALRSAGLQRIWRSP